MVAASAASLVLTAPSDAAVLAQWHFNGFVGGSGVWGPSPKAPDASDSNTTVVGLTRHWPTGSGPSASNAWGGNNFAQAPDNTQVGAIAAGNFVTCSLTANPGYEMSLSGIDPYNIRRSGTGPTTGLWQYSVDGGSFTDIGGAITWGSNTSSPGNDQAAISLSTITALQDVAPGTAVTLRVITWGATSTSGTWYFNQPIAGTTNDLVVNGSVELVPEPGALLSLVVCGGGVLAGRRMRPHSATKN